MITTTQRKSVRGIKPEDDEIVSHMIDQMNKTTVNANIAIDNALVFIEASNKRIEAMDDKAVRPVCFKKII